MCSSAYPCHPSWPEDQGHSLQLELTESAGLAECEFLYKETSWLYDPLCTAQLLHVVGILQPKHAHMHLK